MDVARYADTAGDNADYPVPEARVYRDYIIDSFNADKPYDELMREQVAGDILAREGPPEKFAERVAATGFLALSRRYATGPYELWHLTLEDSIETTGRAFLGLTLRCARCHDHKLEPVTSADYYALYGIFASTQYPYAGSEEFASKGSDRQHFASLLSPPAAGPIRRAHDEKLGALRGAVARLEGELKTAAADGAAAGAAAGGGGGGAPVEARGKKEIEGDLARVRGEIRGLERPGLPAALPCAYAVGEGKPVEARVQLRGDPAQEGPEVKRGAPRFLPGGGPFPIPAGASGRRELAGWLASPGNPLPARVMANRLWHHHFGRGLAATPSNLGLSGERPTHPELLDYLAARLVAGGWSLKALHRLIVLSRTYALASDEREENSARDPENRFCWRHGRSRLEAEAIRDAMLAAGGGLDLRRPEAHPFPPVATWGWTQHHPFKAVYSSNHRSVYLMTQRIQRHPFLALFDGPDTNSTVDARTSATVPLQALFLLNSAFVKAQAEGLARRLLAGPGDAGAGPRIALAHELAYARPPSAEESERGEAYVRRLAAELLEAGAPAGEVELEAWTSYARILLAASEFAYID
jgi:hypothetical protein